MSVFKYIVGQQLPSHWSTERGLIAMVVSRKCSSITCLSGSLAQCIRPLGYGAHWPSGRGSPEFKSWTLRLVD